MSCFPCGSRLTSLELRVIAGVWHRARPQQRPESMKAEHWPAKQVICVENPCFSLPVVFCGPPAGEESAPDGAEQAAPPGVGAHRCCSGLARRRGRIRCAYLAKTHISRSFHAILLVVPSHFANDLYAVLCRTVSRMSSSSMC